MRVLLVDNPAAAHASVSIHDFLRAAGDLGVETTLRFAAPGTRVEDLAHDAEDFDRVVACGGDGTASAVAYRLRGTGIPLLILPAGTANLLAANLRIPTDPIDLARVLVRGETVRADLGEIIAEGRRPSAREGAGVQPPVAAGFCIMAGCGFDANIMHGAKDLKPILGMAAYYVSAMQNLLPAGARFTLEFDDATHETTGIAVLIVNFAKIQFDIALAHDSDPSDGLFEVVVLRTRNAVELLPAIWAALLDRIGEFAPRPGLEIFHARQVRVTADPPLPLQYDGEAMPGTTPFTARVLPGASTFLVGPGVTGSR
jgi:diacylglycerol kinase family enzyme